jgi:hypothetical protein
MGTWRGGFGIREGELGAWCDLRVSGSRTLVMSEVEVVNTWVIVGITTA